MNTRSTRTPTRGARRLGSAALALGVLVGVDLTAAAPAQASTRQHMTVVGSSQLGCQAAGRSAASQLSTLYSHVTLGPCRYAGFDNEYRAVISYR